MRATWYIRTSSSIPHSGASPSWPGTMERTSTTSTNLARAGMAALCAWSVIRAATQSVTPGEAWNYDGYIGPGWRDAFARFDTNNHVLNTLLVRISTARIHLTEFSLRLPSLLF